MTQKSQSKISQVMQNSGEVGKSGGVVSPLVLPLISFALIMFCSQLSVEYRLWIFSFQKCERDEMDPLCLFNRIWFTAEQINCKALLRGLA